MVSGSLTSALKKAAFATPFVFALAAANVNAQTVPFTNGCHDGKTVEAAMAKDGQQPIFVGKRLAEGFPGNAFTMNDNGYGYKLERDPKTQKICVFAYKDVQLNYPDNPEMPNWAMAIKPYNGINPVNAHKNGARFLLVAQSYSRDANGQEILGKAIVVSAGADKLAPVWLVNSKGTPDSMLEMRDFGIVEKNFNYFMGRGFNTGRSAEVQPSITLASAKTPALALK